MPRAVFAACLVFAAGCGAPPVAQPAPAADPNAPPQVVAEETIPPKNGGGGGTPAPAEEDEAPRTASNTAAVSALTGKINLPKDGGAWPAKFAPAAAKVEGKAVKVTTAHGGQFVAASAESGRFVLAEHHQRRDAKADPFATRFVLGDVKTGKILGDWEVSGQLIPVDVSPDGTRFVARNAYHDPKLTVLTVSPDFGLSRKTIVAHDRIVLDPNAGSGNTQELNVKWAGFVGNDRVASAAEGGQVRVFKAASLTKVGTLDGTPGLTPCVTPDRKRLFAHTAGKLVLIDPAECEALATKPWPLPSGPKNMAASPDGATLACAKDGRVRFLTLKTGEYWDQVMPGIARGGAMDPRFFHWNGAFLATSVGAYSPAVPFKVWEYHLHHTTAYTPRQVWSAVRVTPPFQKEGAKIDVAVGAFDLLPPDLAGKVEAGRARPNIYTVAPGAAVRVDVAKLPAAAQSSAKADLEQRLREVGYRPDPAAATVVSLSLDPAVTKNTAYANLVNVPYTHQPLRTQFRHGGKVLWEEVKAKEPPFSVFITGGRTLAQHVAAEGYGRPDYEGMRKAEIPPEFRGPGYPPHGFGHTELTADGARFTAAR